MSQFVLGEFRRSIDDRFRLSLPVELLDSLESAADADWMLVKERPGCLSLWRSEDWGDRLNKDVALVQSKIDSGHLTDRQHELQMLGRLLSTRHRDVRIAGRGRLVLPEGFREFLGAEAGSDVLVIGAAVCIEIWRPNAWIECLDAEIPKFSDLLRQLIG